MRAWVTDMQRPRPRLQGTCDFVQRQRYRSAGTTVPALTEFIEVGSPESALTRYCVLRYVASNWGESYIKVNSSRTLEHFVRPLLDLHAQLIGEGLIDDEPLMSGEFGNVNDDEDLEEMSEAERLRIELQRAQQHQANTLVVAPLPVSFLRVNANLTADRLGRTQESMIN